MVGFLKKLLLCERGDKVDSFLEVLVKPNGEINELKLLELSHLFDDDDLVNNPAINVLEPHFDIKKSALQVPRMFITFDVSANNLIINEIYTIKLDVIINL